MNHVVRFAGRNATRDARLALSAPVSLAPARRANESREPNEDQLSLICAEARRTNGEQRRNRLRAHCATVLISISM